MLRTLFLLMLTPLILTNFTVAQSTPETSKDSSKTTTYKNIFIGFEASVKGSSIQFIGKTKTSDYSILRFYGGTLVFIHPKNHFAIYYTLSADLFSKLHYTVNETGQKKQRRGLGISPAGYTFFFPVSRRISAVTGFSGGFSFFNRYFPDKDGVRVNFTYELRTALNLRIRSQVQMALAARYYHHSNAELGKVNPGMDLIMLSAGFLVRF